MKVDLLHMRSVLLPCLLLLLGAEACVFPSDDMPRTEVVYPVLAPAHAYAAARHVGEGRWGTLGAIGNPKISAQFDGNGKGVLRFAYVFERVLSTEFVGMYFAFGRTAIEVANPDGSDGGTLALDRDGTADLCDFKATESVVMETLRISFGAVTAAAPITVKLELTDGDGNKGLKRKRIEGFATYDFDLAGFPRVDLTDIKLITLLVEELHEADRVFNPKRGEFEIRSVALVDANGHAADAAAIAAMDDASMLEEIGRRDFESLWRLRDVKTGALLDRTLFRDLIHWGSTGWLLAVLPAAVEQGWIEEEAAIAAALRVLRFVDDDAVWGNAPAGMVGNSVGIGYRFGGIDASGLMGPLTGTRKIDRGNVNAVEASVIDWSLFSMGAATCAAGFGDVSPEIQSRVNSILERTDWAALVEPNTGQLYLSWVPQAGPGFMAPAASGGYWASNAEDEPLTIDYWTDEGALAAILAAGSDPALASVWYGMVREEKNGVIVTWPGSFFTYTFMSAIYLSDDQGADDGVAWQAASVDWRENARAAYLGMTSLLGAGVLPDAVEFPNAAYLAQGISEYSLDTAEHFHGVRTPYSLQLALGLGGDVAADAAQQLRGLLQTHPELWDPFYGFLDAYHADLSTFDTPADMPHAAPLIRDEGVWVQQQVFSLNKGCALAALLNYTRDDVIAETARRHPRVASGLDAIYGEDNNATGL
jgi:hypothetical protein